MKKYLAVILSTLLAVLMLAGCSQTVSNQGDKREETKQVTNEATRNEETQTKKKYKIGLSIQAMSNEFIKTMAEAVKEKADEMGVELITMDSELNIEKQLNHVDNLIAQKVDAMILNVVDFQGSSPAVDKVKSAGIPLVEVITFTSNENYDVFVGTDPTQSGEMMGDFLLKTLNGKGNVLLLQGPIGHSAEITRGEGFKTALLDKAPDVKLLAQQTGNWNRDEGMRITEDWLQRFPEIDAIAAENDEMAMGALQAIEAAGRKEILVVGIDGIPDALKAVKDGRLAATILDNAGLEGKRAMEVAVGLLEGKTFQKKELLDYEFVNKDNIDQYYK